MRRRRLLLFLFAGLMIVIAVFLAWPREPEYKGRTLSEWVLIYAESTSRPTLLQTPEAKAAALAIQHIGTNALPWIMQWIRYEPGPWRQKLNAFMYKLPPVFRVADWDRSSRRAQDALVCFHLLGPRASPAITELVRLANDRTFSRRAENAIFALSQIGKDGFPPLAVLLANPQTPHRGSVASYIGEMSDLGTNSAQAVAALVQCLNDPDRRVVVDAAAALGSLALEPGLAAPALAKALHHSDRIVRFEAGLAIPGLGDQARIAVPALLEALNDPDEDVRFAATNALRQIAPEVLPKEDGRPVPPGTSKEGGFK